MGHTSPVTLDRHASSHDPRPMAMSVSQRDCLSACANIRSHLHRLLKCEIPHSTPIDGLSDPPACANATTATARAEQFVARRPVRWHYAPLLYGLSDAKKSIHDGAERDQTKPYTIVDPRPQAGVHFRTKRAQRSLPQ